MSTLRAFLDPNSPVVKQCVVDLDGIGERVDKYLGRRFTYHSRMEWQLFIEDGTVTVNGKTVKPKTRLKKGDVVVYQIHNLVEPPVNKNVKIRYDDGDLIIADKPADLPVIPAGKYHHHTLYSILIKRLGGPLRLINRIDRETSGLIMLARTELTASAMQDIVGVGGIRKVYIVIAKGAIAENRFTVRGNLGTVGSPHYRKMQGFADDGKYSRTDFRVISRTGDYAMLFCRLYTGRTHQIRAHLRESGIYVVGDKIYGEAGPKVFARFLAEGNSAGLLESVEMPRQALHAYKISFVHPMTQKKVQVKAPLPADMREFAKKKGLL